MQLASAFELLGLSPDADRDEARSAYLLRARILHPDHQSADLHQAATVAMSQLNDAWRLVQRHFAGELPPQPAPVAAAPLVIYVDRPVRRRRRLLPRIATALLLSGAMAGGGLWLQHWAERRVDAASASRVYATGDCITMAGERIGCDQPQSALRIRARSTSLDGCLDAGYSLGVPDGDGNTWCADFLDK